MKKYVVGFLFKENHSKVILIRKNRPEWQKDLLNGVGGHIEEGETIQEAMVREFFEETGVLHQKWDNYLTHIFNESTVYFFKAFSDEAFEKCKTMTDEKIVRGSVRPLLEETIPNLKWIIPLALDPFVSQARVHQ